MKTLALHFAQENRLCHGTMQVGAMRVGHIDPTRMMQGWNRDQSVL